MQTIMYEGFINTCKKVFELIQNQKNSKVLMRLNLIWEPKEIKEDFSKSPNIFYSVTPPQELSETGLSRLRIESPSSPSISPPALRDLCIALEKVMNILVEIFTKEVN